MATTVTRREAKDFKYGEPPVSIADPQGLAKMHRRMLYRDGEQQIVTSPEAEASAREDGWTDHAADLERQRTASATAKRGRAKGEAA